MNHTKKVLILLMFKRIKNLENENENENKESFISVDDCSFISGEDE